MQNYIKKTSTKNYWAANSMHVFFRRRVLKVIFYTNIFFPSSPHTKRRIVRQKKKAESCEKIFMHSIYILINSHVRTRRTTTSQTHVSFIGEAFCFCVVESANQVSPFFHVLFFSGASCTSCFTRKKKIAASRNISTTTTKIFFCIVLLAIRAHDSSETN